MKQNPLVSIILPVYNGERFLAQAIESALAQTYSRYELVVVDDGSTDASGEIARSYEQVSYIWQKNGGSGAARNRGLEAISGDYVAFLDADDLWLPDKLDLQMGYLLDHPHIGYTIGRIKFFL